MRLAALRDAPYAFSSTYESALGRSPESWVEQADGSARGPDRATFIAFVDDSPVGIAALYRDGVGMDTGEVLQVWVAPKYRGAGVAAGLLDAIVRWAETNGFREIRATVTRDNEGAARFYQKCDFRPLDGVSLDDGDDLVLMRELGDDLAVTAGGWEGKRIA